MNSTSTDALRRHRETSVAGEGDSELLSKMAAGNIRDAGQILIERHYRVVYRKLRYWCDGNEDEACELTQRVFEKILKNAQEFRNQAKFSTYLHTVARNQFIDYCRVEKSRQYVGLDDDDSNEETDGSQKAILMDQSASPEKLLSIVKDNQRVREAVYKLKPIYKEVIMLRYFEDYSAEEIAVMTSQKFETVRTRIRYGLDQLRVLLSEYYSERI